MSLQTDFSQIFRTITLTLISHHLLSLFPNIFTTVTTPISTTISHPFPKHYRPILYYEISPPSPSHLEHQPHPSHHNLPYHSSLTSPTTLTFTIIPHHSLSIPLPPPPRNHAAAPPSVAGCSMQITSRAIMVLYTLDLGLDACAVLLAFCARRWIW